MENVIEDIDLIPVAIMRRAFEDSQFNISMAADLMGWNSDSDRLRRALGYKKTRAGEMKAYVSYDIATKMVGSWNLDPVDYGV